jgi:hypothetical protein
LVCLELLACPFVFTRANSSAFSHLKAEPGGAVIDASSNRLKEIIPAKYHQKYLKWKSDFLSTTAGRDEWARYATNPNFNLTITVSPEQAEGARVEDYRWDEAGKLIAATIILETSSIPVIPVRSIIRSPVRWLPVTCRLK